jgi:hypothetical protein
MPVVFPQSTKEYVVVEVDDALNNVADLTALTPQFKVLEPDPVDTDKLSWAAVSQVQLMKLFCLVDTSLPTPWAAGTYRLFVRFTATPEVPWLGPYEIEVVAP